MLRSAAAPTLTCPRCEQPGIHGTADECLDALRAAVAGETPRPRPVRPLPRPVPAAKAKPQRASAPPVDPLRPLTVTQASALVQVSRSAIYGWIRDGKLEVEFTPGGSVRIQRSQLLRASRRNDPPSSPADA